MGGDATNDPVVHAYGSNLATRRNPTWFRLGVSNLDSVERQDGELHRGGGTSIGYVAYNPVWRAVHGHALHVVAKTRAGGQEHR